MQLPESGKPPRKFWHEGASICVVDVNASDGQRVVDKINADGGEAIFVRTDVGESAQVIEMFARTEEAFGRVDIVHNNAIWFRHGPATEIEPKSPGFHSSCLAISILLFLHLRGSVSQDTKSARKGNVPEDRLWASQALRQYSEYGFATCRRIHPITPTLTRKTPQSQNTAAATTHR